MAAQTGNALRELSKRYFLFLDHPFHNIINPPVPTIVYDPANITSNGHLDSFYLFL